MERLFRVKRCSWLMLVLMFLVAGCSAPPGSVHDENNNSGGIAYRLSWGGGPSRNAMKDSQQLIVDDICGNYNIQWVSAKAIDHTGNVQGNGRWACTDRQGELSGLPEGTYVVIFQGEVNGTTAWQGETSGIEVIKNQRTDAGLVTMKHLFDNEAPSVVKTIPADEEPRMPVNSAVTATFDNSIVEKSINTENFILTLADQLDGDTSIACTVRYDENNHIAVLTPTQDLQSDTKYTATIAVDKSLVVEDMAGNTMQQATQWTFTTFRVDNDAPYVETRSPDDGDTGLDLRAIVQIIFSEPINPLTITADSIYLHHSGADIQCALSYDEQLNTVTLRPVGDLPSGSTCHVVVTTDVTDLSGNALEHNETWGFATGLSSWYREDSDMPQSFSALKHIALSSNGTPHISSMDIHGTLFFISRTAKNTWAERSIGQGSMIGAFYDMVISSDDIMYTLYWSTSDVFNLCHQTIEPGDIGCDLIDPNDPLLEHRGDSIASADSVPDEGNVVYACYYNANNSQLVFAAENTGWTLEVVDTNAGESPSLAAEPTGEAHISYIDEVNGHLKYATNKSGTWVIEIADNSGVVDNHTAIALDTSGSPHISYREDNKRLKYAVKQSSGGWLIDTVDDSIDVGLSSSLAIDSLNLAHISYSDQSNASLMYATKAAGGSWHSEIVDGNCVGTDSSIIVDDENFIHLAYGYTDTFMGIEFEFLRYATTRPQD